MKFSTAFVRCCHKIFSYRYLRLLAGVLLCVNGFLGLLWMASDGDIQNIAVTQDVYQNRLSDVLHEAAGTLHSYIENGISEDNYTCRYQNTVIQRYTALNVHLSLPDAEIHGWDKYFSYTAAEPILGLWITAAAAVVYAQEYSSGMLTLLRTTRNGRKMSCLAKLIAMAAVTGISVFVLTLQTWGIGALHTGFSGGHLPVQTLTAFMLCPNTIPISALVPIQLLCRFGAFFAYACIVMLCSVIARKLYVAYLYGISIWAGLLAAEFFSDPNDKSILSALNLTVIAKTNPMVDRFRAVNFCGFPVAYAKFAVIGLSILIFVLCVSMMFCFCNVEPMSLVRTATTKTTTSNVRQRILCLPVIHCCSVSLSRHELYKLLIGQKYLFLLCVLLLARGVLLNNEYEKMLPYDELVYQSYMTEYEGPLTKETVTAVEVEAAYLEKIESAYDEMFSAYRNGAIDYDDYTLYKNPRVLYYITDTTIEQVVASGKIIFNTPDEGIITAEGYYIDIKSADNVLYKHRTKMVKFNEAFWKKYKSSNSKKWPNDLSYQKIISDGEMYFQFFK